MDNRTLASLAEDNLLRSIECWARAAGGSYRETNGFHVSTAPVPLRSFNQIIITRPVAEVADLKAALTTYGESDRFRVRALTDHALGPGVLAAAGLTLRGGIPSMALESPSLVAADRLDVRQVEDERALSHMVRVVGEAFDWEASVIARVFTASLLTDPVWLGWIGYVGGDPVTTAMLVVTGDVAGVYYVGTAIDHRGKGLGSLITRAAVNEATSRECRVVTLQASPLGRPVYERMGFRTVAEYETYVPL